MIPRSFPAQDRGVVCWPFHGSLNEALLCVFDGHGPRGEKVSEFCMTTLPTLLEEDHELLVRDPRACLAKNVCMLDWMLSQSPLGRHAETCGTTSNVIYMRGSECWVACSGDSRAIKASRVNGKLVATDLSVDHKPGQSPPTLLGSLPSSLLSLSLCVCAALLSDGPVGFSPGLQTCRLRRRVSRLQEAR